MSKKMDLGGSRDLISGLPKELIGHILSFLPTKEAASTSALSRKWRYLFALVHNIDLVSSMETVDQKSDKVFTSFMDFVDRALALQGNSPLHKFSLKITDGEDDPDHPVDPNRIFRWILNVLERGVSDLDLSMNLETDCMLPSKIFLNETLARLKIDVVYGPEIDVEHVYLPKLKTLYLASIYPKDEGVGLSKLLAGCHILEDLVLEDMSCCNWDFSSVSVPTLKRLSFSWQERGENPNSVSFDTPNLVYLEYTETIAVEYPIVNFESLVEARIDLRMSEEQMELTEFLEDATHEALQIHYAEGHEENELIGNATNFVIGICNVKILYLSADTLQVLTYSCEVIPLFNNLTHLTIESNRKLGWQSLPGLLKKSPNLETLVLLGLVHKATNKCGDVCLCKPCEDEEEDVEDEEIQTCLSSSPVKVLKIMKFAETYDDKIEKKIKQAKHFLKTMPNLEQLILYYDTTFEEDVIEVSSQLQSLSRVASSRCNVQVISDHLSLSSIVPSSISMKWTYYA